MDFRFKIQETKRKGKPVLFEMPTYQYLKTGEVLGKCMSMGGKEA